MRKMLFGILTALCCSLSGCSYKKVEYPVSYPAGYYNGYVNKNVLILYKRPSAKFGCWRTGGGWECVRQ